MRQFRIYIHVHVRGMQSPIVRALNFDVPRGVECLDLWVHACKVRARSEAERLANNNLWHKCALYPMSSIERIDVLDGMWIQG